LTKVDYVDTWIDNPQGYAGVLKGGLPHFILIPAVRDLADETKATKSNPLGRLLYSVLAGVTEDQNQVLSQSLGEMQMLLNRSGGEKRMMSISATEKKLNTFLKDYMDCDLEIEFQAPTLEVLMTTPRMYADDGFRNQVENKGHGLQRAIIFSILRCYSELITGSGSEKSRTMILGVEEPELYMHPQAQRTIQRVFRSIASSGDQVIFSTHSSLLLDVAYFDEILRVETLPDEHNGKKTVQSRVYQLPMENILQDIRKRYPSVNPTGESVRQLYANAYHPTRAEGFFAKKLILVEGATEHYSLPIYAHAMGLPLDILNVGIVECGGKGPMDRLYRVFNELRIPCYLVFDYDKDNTDKTIISKSQEILQLLGKSPDLPTQLLVDDCFACFPTNWESELKKEIPDYDALAQEARSNLGLSSDTGKPLTARYIAKSLTSRTTPYIPPSIRSILERATTVSWVSTCLSK
jgi:predicted ATP-dependent endonuclease of OLD family